ncbi:hypothetical protein PALB_1620 [Pseudoalteromonas luteoviolacea B = ATCC 29581]|nr:hypothetical protein PALB_1620 [Pseudoalteromonas luteoviolacea B = ATCC 29581]
MSSGVVTTRLNLYKTQAFRLKPVQKTKLSSFKGGQLYQQYRVKDRLKFN